MIRPAAATTRPGTSNLKRKLAAASNMNSDGSGSSDEPLISDDSVDNPSSESEYSDFDDSHLRKICALRATTPITKNPHQTLQTPPPSSSEKPTPTRVQPSRAVKRKVDTTPSLLPLTPAKTPSPKRRKMTPVVERPKSEPNAEHRESPRPEDQTKGDYTLSKHDFEEYQPDYADRGSHADGLDVAYFMIEVEKAVDVAINELVAARLGNGVFSLSSPSEIDQGGIRGRWRRLGIIASHTNVVGHKNRSVEEESKDEEEVFVPAGDAVSGEDRRPLAPSRSAPPEVNKGGKKGLELRLVSRQGTPAPEAPMELSPTLGRWQLAGDRRGSGSSRLGGSRAGDRVKMKREVDSKAVAAEKESGLGSGGEGAVVGSPMESNKRSIQVSGLKFDVELRTLEVGEYGESKKTIWFHML